MNVLCVFLFFMMRSSYMEREEKEERLVNAIYKISLTLKCPLRLHPQRVLLSNLNCR